MNVIFDCDNTFGVSGCDVDDGLALLYLLGSERANLLGITNTYGNSNIDAVYQSTAGMLKETGYKDIPHLKGGAAAGELKSEAVDFLAETVSRYAGNIAILATGSLTNLYGAYRKDPDFFKKVSRISLMGGLTEPLLINGKILNELNFSCDPEAAFYVLTKGRNIQIATGNNCLDAFFSREGYEHRLSQSVEPAARYIYDRTAYWYEDNMKSFGIDGFYNWDVTAAACLLNEAFFDKNVTMISPDISSLKNGYLLGSGESIRVSLPKILNGRQFEDHVYETYCKVKMKF